MKLGLRMVFHRIQSNRVPNGRQPSRSDRGGPHTRAAMKPPCWINVRNRTMWLSDTRDSTVEPRREAGRHPLTNPAMVMTVSAAFRNKCGARISKGPRYLSVAERTNRGMTWNDRYKRLNPPDLRLLSWVFIQRYFREIYLS